MVIVALPGFSDTQTVQSSSENLTNQIDNAVKRLSSGQILPTDNPAGIAISERMRSQMSSLESAQRNITNQISMHQTAQGFGQNISNNLTRMRDLAVQARGVTNETDRGVMEEEFKMLQDDIARVTSRDTALGEFNSQPLFQGDELTVQTGPNSGQTTTVKLADLQITSTEQAGDLTFGQIIDSANGLQMMDDTALDSLSSAIDLNSSVTAQNAAQERAAQERYEGLQTYHDNLRNAESSIRDIDFAQESTNLAQLLVQKQMNDAIMGQGLNLNSFTLLSLL